MYGPRRVRGKPQFVIAARTVGDGWHAVTDKWAERSKGAVAVNKSDERSNGLRRGIRGRWGGTGLRSTVGVAVAGLVLAGCGGSVTGTPVALSSSTGGSSSARSSTAASSAAPSSSAPSTSGPALSTASAGTSAESSSAVSAPTSGSPTESSGSSSDSAPPAGSGSASGTVDPAEFAAEMQAGNAKVSTLKGAITVESGPIDVSGTFNETLAASKVSAIDMSMFLKQSGESLPLRMLIVDNKFYIGGSTLLTALKAGNKKWALVSKSSKNAALSKLADQLDGYLQSASAQQYELFAKAARSIVDNGEQKLGGVQAHKYTVTVDVVALGKLMSGTSQTSMQALADSGIKTLPTTLWLDDDHRVIQSESTIKVSGVTTHTVFKVTNYNVPVSITAPAASDVYTG